MVDCGVGGGGGGGGGGDGLELREELRRDTVKVEEGAVTTPERLRDPVGARDDEVEGGGL